MGNPGRRVGREDRRQKAIERVRTMHGLRNPDPSAHKRESVEDYQGKNHDPRALVWRAMSVGTAGRMRVLRLVSGVGMSSVLGIGVMSVPASSWVRPTILAPERQEPEAEHVKRGHAGSDDADQPQQMLTAAPGAPKNSVLGKEGGKRRQAGDSDCRRGHAPERPRHVFSEAAHEAHVLLA